MSRGPQYGPNPQAEELIRRYLPSITNRVRWWRLKYPDEDVEPRICSALYNAAYTWDGKHSFVRWWNWKQFGAMSGIKARRQRWNNAGVIVERMPIDAADTLVFRHDQD